MSRTNQAVEVDGRTVQLSNLDKLIWPSVGITKADLIHYIFMVSHVLLPHLRNRPLTVTRYPDGVDGEWFFQKDCPQYAPDWIRTYPVVSKDEPKSTNYILANDAATLVWLANQAAIEYHPWMSRVESPAFPDYSVIDLDPSEGATFSDTRRVAAAVKEILDHFGLVGFPKLSGATGIHIYVPLNPGYTYKQSSRFAGHIGRILTQAMPETATNVRRVKDRDGKVYIDHLQNLPGKTIVSAYSPRPNQGACVSTPFHWEELDRIAPSEYTIDKLDALLERSESFQQLYRTPQSIDHVLSLFQET